MKKKLMLRPYILLSAVLVAALSNSFPIRAAEDAPGAKESQSEPKKDSGDAEDSKVGNKKEPVDVRGDGGVAAVQKVQEEGLPENHVAGASAQECLNNRLKESELSAGWNEDKKRFIAIGVAEFNSEDPTIDPGKFFLNREIAIQRSLLDARSQIIEFANSKMDVVVQSECPGTDLYAAFNEKKEAQVRRLEAQKKVVAELVGELDKAMADTLKGATTRDRINALMDAAIKKLDASYGASNIVAEKKERYERAKSRYQEASQELAKIDEEIKKAAGSVSRSFNSKIGKIAKMPLFGSSCLEQAESWDSKTETYSVAVAMVWSVGLEKATRAIVQGQEIILDAPKKDKLTVQAWLEKQDLSFMNGPRTYMDGKGERYFLGVAARPIVAQASRREKNRDMARLQADGMAVLSLRADVEVAKLAEQMAQTITVSDAKEDEMALESFSKKVSAKLVGQNVSGLASAFYEKEIQHGTTGIKTLVTVSCISPQSVKAARTMEEINYAAAIAGNKENARMQGRKDAMQAEEKAARNDPGSYRKGAQEGSEALKKQEVTRQAQQQKNLQKQAKTPPEKNTTRTSTVNGAVSSGKGKIDDDFE